MNGTVSSLLVVVLVVYAVCCAFLYTIQRSFIYYPTPESANPAAKATQRFHENRNADDAGTQWKCGG